MFKLRRYVQFMIVLSGALAVAASGQLNAQTKPKTTVKKFALAVAEKKAIDNCLNIIRACQLQDGAFNMVNNGSAAGSPVWIAPYFVNHAMLALLAANDYQKSVDDVTRVGKWLAWSADHQEKGGYWHDYVGTIAAYHGNGMVDAHDSSAALYLLVAERYRRAGGKLTEKMIAAALASWKCIQTVSDTDGLTWAKPDYKVKFLMDNIEVYAGLVSAEQLFQATKKPVEEKAVRTQKVTLGKQLKAYWEATAKSQFAWAQHEGGKFDGGLEKLYPQGLAQLFGVAFVAAESVPFDNVVKTFQPQTTPEGVGAERFLIAASRIGGMTEKTWRDNVAKDASTFTPKKVYLFRPGLVILSLLEGAEWMGCLLNQE